MIRPEDYTYHLPQERIALYPLEKRDASRLLVYNKGNIEHARFFQLADYLPQNTVLFLNDTRVIHARLLFTKPTGAVVEIFLLSPEEPFKELNQAMQTPARCVWKCNIGNLKRWKDGALTMLSKEKGIELNARLLNREEGLVELSWQPAHYTLADILHDFGKTPLPPYIQRPAEEADENRYQTVYSRHEGAVAAPTAGLHFTESVFDSLRNKGITWDFLTLHVSAGTFQPIKTADALQHVMHEEQVVIRRDNLELLAQPDKFIVAVGTTSMRTLESLYWYGVKLIANPEADFYVGQDEPRNAPANLPTLQQVLDAIARRMDRLSTHSLTGRTAVYIYPGYRFKVCKGLITNFHLPGSTLILLVAAFVGNDWRRIYQEALDNGYRFLSYGDSSLLLPAQS
ncbi:MAG: S-adenosylmethionine:tRNA ribosyltransferase-isomerase [Cyclobacteriaceae bacterium]|nr:S-adenosylmethionine:tRNA ribosyltransferase-isomerase [Cyclobacteriaceae bacterium]